MIVYIHAASVAEAAGDDGRHVHCCTAEQRRRCDEQAKRPDGGTLYGGQSCYHTCHAVELKDC